MKVQSIITEATTVTNAGELADAFTSEEWLKIANYFIDGATVYGGSLGDNQDDIRRFMIRINRDVGANQPSSQTASTWNHKAHQYNMHMTNVVGRPTWEKIYNHLLGALNDGAEVPEEFSIPGIVMRTGLPPDMDDSPEDYATGIGDWVPDINKNQEWTNYQSLATEYLRPWYRALVGEGTEDGGKRGKRWRDWLGTRYAETNNPNAAIVALHNLRDNVFPREIQNNGSISKTAVDRRLFGWLNSADRMYRQWVDSQD
jgi:hypothetical protein